MKQAFIYSTKVWITAVLLGPFIQEVAGAITGQLQQDVPVSTFLMILLLLGLVLSLPSFIVLFLAVRVSYNFKTSITSKKIAFTVLGFILSVLPFYILFGYDNTANETGLLLMTLSYSLSIIAGIWFYTLGVDDNSINAPILHKLIGDE